MSFKVSDHGAKFIKSFEKEVLKVYDDGEGYLTAGVGHLLSPAELQHLKLGDKITPEQSFLWFKNDLDRFEKCVNGCVTAPINQNQFDALVSLAFNIGERNFKRSSLLKKLNNKDYSGTAKAFESYNKSNGQVLKGLIRRRAQEELVFNLPDTSLSLRVPPAPRPADNPPVALPIPQPSEESITPPNTSAPDTDTPRTFSVVGKLSSAVTWLQNLTERSSTIEASVSKSSWASVILKKAVGYSLILVGFLFNNPIYLLAGVALIAVAAWYLSHSKDRSVAKMQILSEAKSDVAVATINNP